MKEKKGISRTILLSGEKTTRMVFGVLLSSIGTVLQLSPYLSVYKILEQLLNKAGYIEDIGPELLTRWSMIGIAGLLTGFLFTYLGSMLCHLSAYRFICGTRLKIAEHIGNMPMGYFNNNSVGKIKQVIDGDVEQIEVFFAHQLPDLISTVVMLIVLFVVMFITNAWLAFACLIPIVIGFVCQLIAMVKVIKGGGINENFDALERISSSAIQYVKGMPSIKIFGQTIRSFKRFYDDIIQYRDFTTRMSNYIRVGYVQFRTLVLSVATIMLPVGLILFFNVSTDAAMATTLIFFLILGPGAATPTLKLRSFSESMNLINESVNRIDDVLDTEVLIEVTTQKEVQGYDISFHNVSFRYSGKSENVIKNISFTAKQGEITALVGPSGAGKSTIAELIPRFWDIPQGEIAIGGIDIKQIPTAELMKKMAFVFQDSFIFSDTVYGNIAMGSPNATKEQVIQASKAAQCHDYIMAMPDGYNTRIGDGESFLSGGEAQRLSIARAILKDAPILILDEASAYADAENEHLMQRALQQLIKNKTVIMIAHRLTTIRGANQILVVQDGQIIETGTHVDLLEKKGLYASLWKTSTSSTNWKLHTSSKGVTA